MTLFLQAGREEYSDEVFMGNVLGDHGLITQRQKKIKESSRILKTGGVLRVLENYTPDKMNLKDLRNLLTRVRFVQFNFGEENDESDLLSYSSFGTGQNPESYLTQFHKISES